MSTRQQIEDIQHENNLTRSEPFTAREFEVYCYIVAGNRNRDIALALNISIKTVEKHRARVYLKTGSHSLVDLFIYEQRTNFSKRKTDEAAGSTSKVPADSELTISATGVPPLTNNPTNAKS